jgi:putative flavoprotein involved in K+ transport
VPVVPRCAERLPADIAQIHSSLYRNPEQLPPGAVLVVGSGQSGCQIAEDLHLAGRKVHLCVGDAPRVARRYRGKDVVEWLHLMGYYDLPVHEHPLREGVRDKTNHYVNGRRHRPPAKIALARIDVNALRVPVNWALLALPVDIDVAT